MSFLDGAVVYSPVWTGRGVVHAVAYDQTSQRFIALVEVAGRLTEVAATSLRTEPPPATTETSS